LRFTEAPDLTPDWGLLSALVMTSLGMWYDTCVVKNRSTI
jgi:hypothetical protein